MVQGFDRNYEGSGLTGTIFLSLLLHAALISLFFFSPSFSSPKLTFGPVYNVDLVDLPGGAFSSGRAPAVGLPAPAVVEKGVKGIKRVETVVKRSSVKVPIVPITKIERSSRDKEDNGALQKAIEKIKKNVAAGDTQKPSAQTPFSGRTASDAKTGSGSAENSTAASGFGSGAGKSSPGEGGSEGDARVNAYYTEIWRRIKLQWALPGGMMPKNALESVISITILRSGTVTETKFEKSSGNRYFDDSVMKAIQKASPLPPLPEWINGSSLSVGIRFHSAELIK
jgi:TonB family protein